ncbi:MAG: hypothetical protein JL50_11215 [Peptococcaceae bacterium BICA1-7]|nr:MAG: hypothetical protein JL50_11215 [Peptococcaceae bacterium BICA1-7]
MISEQKIEQKKELSTDLISLIRIIWHRRFLIFLIFLSAIVISILFCFFVPPVYRTSTVISLGKCDSLLINRETAKIMLTGDSLLNRVSTSLGLNINDVKKIVIEDMSDPQLIKVIVENSDPQQAKIILDKVTALYLETAKQDFVKDRNNHTDYMSKTLDQISTLEQGIKSANNLLSEIKRLPDGSLDKNIQYFSVYYNLLQMEERKEALWGRFWGSKKELDTLKEMVIVSETGYPDYPFAPNKKLYIAIGAILGVLIGITTVFAIEFCPRFMYMLKLHKSE